jgi:hypothetical protein
MKSAARKCCLFIITMYDVHRRCSGDIIRRLAASRDGASTALHKPLRRNILSSYDMAISRAFFPPMD